MEYKIHVRSIFTLKVMYNQNTFYLLPCSIYALWFYNKKKHPNKCRWRFEFKFEWLFWLCIFEWKY